MTLVASLESQNGSFHHLPQLPTAQPRPDVYKARSVPAAPVVALAALGALPVASALTAAGRPGSVYDIDPLPHVVTTFALAGLTALSETLIKRDLRAALPGEAHLGRLDCLIPGSSRGYWRTISDVMLVGSCIGAAGVALLGHLTTASSHGLDYAATDMLMIAETALIANFVTDLLKYAKRRRRPAASGSPGVDFDLSFPSGHTSVTAAVATACSVGLGLRHPSAGFIWACAGVTGLLTSIAGYGRIRGSRHYLTDVLGGALLGWSVGFVWPYVNRVRG